MSAARRIIADAAMSVPCVQDSADLLNAVCDGRQARIDSIAEDLFCYAQALETAGLDEAAVDVYGAVWRSLVTLDEIAPTDRTLVVSSACLQGRLLVAAGDGVGAEEVYTVVAELAFGWGMSDAVLAVEFLSAVAARVRSASSEADAWSARFMTRVDCHSDFRAIERALLLIAVDDRARMESTCYDDLVIALSGVLWTRAQRHCDRESAIALARIGRLLERHGHLDAAQVARALSQLTACNADAPAAQQLASTRFS
jgi:hypothetical protein